VEEKPDIDLLKIAAPHGFVDCAATVALSVDEKERLRFRHYLDEGYNADMEYLSKNLDKRFNPPLLVDECCTILCFLAPYGQRGGSIASFAHGKDYHKVVKDKLYCIVNDLTAIFPGFKARPFVDSAPVLERYWAAKAGLGFIGLNNMLISPQFGLRTIIGIILCNIPHNRFIVHIKQNRTDCGNCGRCIAACPNQALLNKDGSHFLDARRCISYLTIESKTLYGATSADDKRPFKFCGQIFGCEKCIDVCPWDKALPGLPELETNADTVNIHNWKEMDRQQFKDKFRDTGLFRTGLDKIIDNTLQR